MPHISAHQGAVAAGHEQTAAAAQQILAAGGNAFDAIIGAHFCACVCEPVLASVGGGGFLLAHPFQGQACLYDFFVQTPRQRAPANGREFYPIVADFGPATQEFHIGRAAAATPGAVAGLFAAHRDLGRMPLAELLQPAQQLARQGIELNSFQRYILQIIRPIFATSRRAQEIYQGLVSDALPAPSAPIRNPELADLLEALGHEGARLFYEGEVAAAICADQRDHGHLTRADFAHYEVLRREPLDLPYRDVRLLTNPPPSSGGLLIGFALQLLDQEPAAPFATGDQLLQLATAMALTNRARAQCEAQGSLDCQLLTPDWRAPFDLAFRQHRQVQRGTTHISVIDEAGNAAALTVSNGEGCGYMIPGTGSMLNNMLGEEDLNRQGFHQWPLDQRLGSMMAPTLVEYANGDRYVLGSGGSNRIRSAILQVISQLIDQGCSLHEAIHRPRLHLEGERLSIEAGFSDAALDALSAHHAHIDHWPEPNLFFGGVHGVGHRQGRFFAAGDPRRGGYGRVLGQ